VVLLYGIVENRFLAKSKEPSEVDTQQKKNENNDFLQKCSLINKHGGSLWLFKAPRNSIA
jgi:hypothetical protein